MFVGIERISSTTFLLHFCYMPSLHLILGEAVEQFLVFASVSLAMEDEEAEGKEPQDAQGGVFEPQVTI